MKRTAFVIAGLLAVTACQKSTDSCSAPAASAEQPKTVNDQSGAAAPTEQDKAGAPAPGEPGVTAGDNKVTVGGTKIDDKSVTTGNSKIDKNGVKVGGSGVTTDGKNTNIGGGVQVKTGADGKKKVNVGGVKIGY